MGAGQGKVGGGRRGPCRGGAQWTAGLTCFVTESMSLTYRSCSVRTPVGRRGAHGKGPELLLGNPQWSLLWAQAQEAAQGCPQAERSWGQRPPSTPTLPAPRALTKPPQTLLSRDPRLPASHLDKGQLLSLQGPVWHLDTEGGGRSPLL